MVAQKRDFLPQKVSLIIVFRLRYLLRSSKTVTSVQCQTLPIIKISLQRRTTAQSGGLTAWVGHDLDLLIEVVAPDEQEVLQFGGLLMEGLLLKHLDLHAVGLALLKTQLAWSDIQSVWV